MTVSLLHSRLTAFIACSVKHESKWKCSDISPKQKRRKRENQWIKEESSSLLLHRDRPCLKQNRMNLSGLDLTVLILPNIIQHT